MEGDRWADRTPIVDRGGRRTRFYARKRTDGPGAQERRLQRMAGLVWCRGCKSWISQIGVKGGVCRTHANENYRRAYAAGAKVAIAARVHARKRGVAPVPPEQAEQLLDHFQGRCAYCPAPATTWDHLVPVSKGGQTKPWNIVPACRSCNSRKRTLPPESMPGVSPLVIDILILEDVL